MAINRLARISVLNVCLLASITGPARAQGGNQPGRFAIPGTALVAQQEDRAAQFAELHARWAAFWDSTMVPEKLYEVKLVDVSATPIDSTSANLRLVLSVEAKLDYYLSRAIPQLEDLIASTSEGNLSPEDFTPDMLAEGHTFDFDETTLRIGAELRKGQGPDESMRPIAYVAAGAIRIALLKLPEGCTISPLERLVAWPEDQTIGLCLQFLDANGDDCVLPAFGSISDPTSLHGSVHQYAWYGPRDILCLWPYCDERQRGDSSQLVARPSQYTVNIRMALEALRSIASVEPTAGPWRVDEPDYGNKRTIVGIPASTTAARISLQHNSPKAHLSTDGKSIAIEEGQYMMIEDN